MADTHLNILAAFGMDSVIPQKCISPLIYLGGQEPIA